MNDPRILGPIPTPTAQRWREIRLLYLPKIVFAVGVIVAAWMWNRWVTPATFVAEATAVQSEVRTSAPGTLASLKVVLFQPVKAGDVVALVTTSTPQVAEATVALMRAELQALSSTLVGVTDRQRLALDFERLQVELMSRRVDLIELKGRLRQAEADLASYEPLARQGLVTELAVAQLRVLRGTLTTQVDEQAKLVAHLEPIVRTHAPRDEGDPALATPTALAAALKVAEAKVRLAEAQMLPTPLLAPTDGVVSFVFRRSGENLATGESIVRITATKPDRLAGYLRQPIAMDVKPGVVAVLRTRGHPRLEAESKVVEVGPGLEPISPNLQAALRLPTNMPAETALRVHVALPPGFAVRPGEIVDVVLP